VRFPGATDSIQPMPYCPECSAYVPERVETCPTCGASLAPTPPTNGGSHPAAPPSVDTERVAGDLSAALGAEYQFLRLVGVGGMGAVFLYREVALKRLVAVKVMAPGLAADAAARARFTREARSAAALSHPNVVRVYGVGETAELELPYIVMQYVEGPSLAEWMQRHPRASEREGRRIVGEVAAGLAAAHARGLLHRDVKPANVLLEAETGRAYVADFGVSAAVASGAGSAGTDTGASLTATGHVVGTPIYMSPEQAAGEALTPKSDVYSLGVMAYELLVGELPFKATTAMGWAAAHLRDTPTPVGHRRADLAPEVARLVDRCVAKDPMDRPTAGDVERGMMPTLVSEIDWPPPGLHWLHGRARALSRLALATFAGAVLTLSALAFTPPVLRARANWLWAFQNPSGRDPASVSLFLWQTELIFGVSILALGLLAFLVFGTGAARGMVRLRAAGWRWGTLVDIAADPDGRSGLALAGAREFASLDPARRRAILAARRWRAGAQLWAVLWTLVAVGGWGALLLSGYLTARPLVPVVGLGFWLVALGPPLLGAAAAALAWLRERNITGFVRARRARRADADAAAWYERLPGDLRPAAAPPSALRRFAGAGQLVTVLLALVAVIVVGEVVASSVTSVLFLQRLGPNTAKFVTDQTRLAQNDPLGSAAHAWAAFLPAPDTAADSTVLGWARTLTGLDPSAPGDLPPYVLSPATVLGRGAAVQRVLGEAVAGRLPAALRDTLTALAANPRTALFERLARARPDIPVLAGLGEPLAALTAESRTRSGVNGRLHDALLANTAGAILDASRGDWRAATARIGLNAAFGAQLLRAPDVRTNQLGFRVLHDDVLTPLAVLARRHAPGVDSARVAAATTALDQAVPFTSGAAGLMVDPQDALQFTAAVQNPHIPAGYRVVWLVDGWAGLCANPWELLTGPSDARKQAMLGAADVMTDVPHARTLAATGAGYWEMGTAQIGASGLRHDLLERGPWGVLWRVRQCTNAI
jgi:hypothetical protein